MIYRWDDYSLDVDARRLTGPEGDVHVEPQVVEPQVRSCRFGPLESKPVP